MFSTSVQPEKGVVDITTRQNIQLCGVKLEDGPTIIDGLHARNQTSFQSALDNVRNMVGSPLAGIDDQQQEMVDTRELCEALNDLICLDPVTGTRGNPYWVCASIASGMIKFAHIPGDQNPADVTFSANIGDTPRMYGPC